MAKAIKPENLSAAISEELSIWGQEITAKVNGCTQASAQKLVKLTRATAPAGKRKKFRKYIACEMSEKKASGSEMWRWFVRKPEYRLTHLLVNGHATRNGGRVAGNPFLANALEQVLPEYEEKIAEVIENA